jgi:DNA mismatch endonuclease (patch repair protein)
VDKKIRSKIMSSVASKNTGPEMIVRRLIFAAGFRYRLHPTTLPGRPDIAFPGRRKVIFVHGCFWHQHRNCSLGKLPKSNLSYWAPKLEGNVTRDRRNIAALKKAGWEVLVIWQCELRNLEKVETKIVRFLRHKKT